MVYEIRLSPLQSQLLSDALRGVTRRPTIVTISEEAREIAIDRLCGLPVGECLDEAERVLFIQLLRALPEAAGDCGPDTLHDFFEKY